MLYRRSRTESPRASPFVVLSSMEITLLTVVYAGPQTALDLPGRVRHLPVCRKRHVPEAFQPVKHTKKTIRAPPQQHSAFRLRVITWNDKPRFSTLSAPFWHASLTVGLSFIAP